MPQKRSKEQPNQRKVFVVHGRNEPARQAMFDFLLALGLEPMEWIEVLSSTNSGSPFIGEAVDRALDVAQAIVVLMTGDDIARLRSGFLKANDDNTERRGTPQARPNVIFEAGLAFGRRPDRTILVELGPCRSFSDKAGRYVVRLNDSPESRQILAGCLKNAGCLVDTTSRLNWLHTGSFENGINAGGTDYSETPNARGVTLREACQDCGLVDMENRDDSRHPIPPEAFYAAAQQEVAISGVSAYRTFDQQIHVVRYLLDSGKLVYILILDPVQAVDDLSRLAAREKKDVRSDIQHVIATIKHERLYANPAFRIRFLPRLPPFTAAMIDGNLEHDPAKTNAPPRDQDGQIRVQPVSWQSTHHTGIIIQLRKKASRPLGVFDYFSEDLRKQWRDGAEHPEFWS